MGLPFGVCSLCPEVGVRSWSASTFQWPVGLLTSAPHSADVSSAWWVPLFSNWLPWKPWGVAGGQPTTALGHVSAN